MKQEPFPHPAWRRLNLALSTETVKFIAVQGYFSGLAPWPQVLCQACSVDKREKFGRGASFLVQYTGR